MNTIKNITGFVTICAALTGCASTGHGVHFLAASVPAIAADAPRVAEAPVTITSAQIVSVEEAAPEPAESVAIDALPAADVELLQAERAHEYASSFTLTPHRSSALSFHCVSGEESLGCAAKPAADSNYDVIERNFDVVLADR